MNQKPKILLPMKINALLFFFTAFFAFSSTAQTARFIDLEKDYECGSIYTYQIYPIEESRIVLHLKVSDNDAMFLEAKQVTERKMYFFSNEKKNCVEYSSELLDLNISFDPEKEKFYFQLGKEEDERVYQIIKKSTLFYNGSFLQYASSDMAFQLLYKNGKFEDLGGTTSTAIVSFDSFEKKQCYHNIKLTVRSKEGKYPPRIMVLNPEMGVISLEDKHSSRLSSGLVRELTSIDYYNYIDFLELKCKFQPSAADVYLPPRVNSVASTVSTPPIASNNNSSALDPFVSPLAVKPLNLGGGLANNNNNIPTEYGSNYGYGNIIVFHIDRGLYVNKYTGEKANGMYGGVLYVDGISMDKRLQQQSTRPDGNGAILLASRGEEEEVPKNDTDCLEVSTMRTHVVQRGENIIDISRLYDIDVRSLKQWNGMSNAINLYPCMRLYLHPPKDDRPKGNTKVTCSESPTYNTHIVQSDENIVSIANFYGITTQQLKNWNGLRTNYVSPCTRLLIQRPTDYSIVITPPHQTTRPDMPARNIPSEYETVVPITTNNFHTVKKGDTLYSIARKYQIELKDLMEWNGLSSNLISLGQKLKLQP